MIRLAVVGLIGILWGSQTCLADTIVQNWPEPGKTFADRPPGTFVQAGGAGQLLLVGQVFQVPDADAALASFTIWAKRFQHSAGQPATTMRAAVFEWDRATLRPVGPALFVSGPVGPLRPGGPPMLPYEFNMGDTELITSGWYAVIAEGDSQTEWGVIGGGVGTEGYLVAKGGGLDTVSGAWESPILSGPFPFTHDLGFSARFVAPTPVPEPGPATMLALSLMLGLCFYRKVRDEN